MLPDASLLHHRRDCFRSRRALQVEDDVNVAGAKSVMACTGEVWDGGDDEGGSMQETGKTSLHAPSTTTS